MEYQIPSTGPISFGTRAGSDRSISALWNAGLSTIGINVTSSLSGASTYIAGNSAVYTVPNMLSARPYAYSEFRSAKRLNTYLDIIWRVTIDGSDYYNWNALSNQLSVVHRNWSNPSSSIITYIQYTNDGVVLSGTTTGNATGVTNLPFDILETNNVIKKSATGRGSVSITQYPQISNDYTTIVLLNDDNKASSSVYTFTLTYQYPE